MPVDSSQTDLLFQQARAGEPGALDRLLDEHRPYLKKVVEVRLDRMLRARVDPSDVIQESPLEAVRRWPEYRDKRPLPFRLCLRQTACQKLVDLRRAHLGAGCRTVLMEVPLPTASSQLVLRAALGGRSRLDQQLARGEVVRHVQQALAELSEVDSEIILMRNFEELSNQEVAEILAIDSPAASKRYVRALARFRQVLLSRGMTGAEP